MLVTPKNLSPFGATDVAKVGSNLMGIPNQSLLHEAIIMFASSKSNRTKMSWDASESAKGMAFGSQASILMPRCASTREIPKREVYV